ncbi:uncharacterized protein FIBRA_02831 [Fibroporia radiculosa]|uniref:DUF6593 domain-containing protein n=1 Tax=Fibroporia radiculosa TaxID=599839 RepID=J4H226_9APHY|nr:uncharacterized protein FIBRA_02831 [Fibroporia radiculosa]CCM00789.1 predicted protein [Fibroporia radiculosa]
MVLALCFQRNDPLNSTIADQGGLFAGIRYEATTTRSFITRRTTLSARTPHRVVAQIEWNTLARDRVTIGGRTLYMSDILAKGGPFGKTQACFPGGPVLHANAWKTAGRGNLVLVDGHDGALVARSYRLGRGFFGFLGGKMILEIESRGMASADFIVLSFVVVEHLRRTENKRRAALVASSAA